MTELKIVNGEFYINGVISNRGNFLSEGRLIGIYTDMCGFFDRNTGARLAFDCARNKREFIENLKIWRGFGINLITIGLQSPNPFEEYYKKAREQDKSKNISFDSSALKRGGSLDFDYLENAEEIIRAAGSMGFAVLVNILSSACEDIFEDEFDLMNGIFNAADWLTEKKFTNILVNITDVSHTFYKSSVLNGEKIINVLKSFKKRINGAVPVGAGIKTFGNIKNTGEYIELSDFIPFYAKRNHNTGRMVRDIYFFREMTRKTGREIPLLMVKGDDLSEKYSTYGKDNITEALENRASWCYYDKDGFVMLPVNWDKNSSPKKVKFFKAVENIQNMR